jgi:hypothetical protein
LTLDNILLRPWEGPFRTPADLGFEFEDVFIESQERTRIHGWRVRFEGAPGTLLIHPGIEGNVERFLPGVMIAQDLGLDAVIYDFQGFGRSEGQKSLDLLKPDALAMTDWLIGLGKEERGEIIHLGISFGTLVASAVALERPEDTAAIILEGSLTPLAIPGQWLEQRFGGETEILGGLANLYMAAELPVEIDAMKFIEQVTTPKLFIHSPDDPITPWPGGLALFEQAAEPKHFYSTLGGHVKGHQIDPNYLPTLRWFLTTHVGLPVADDSP